MRNHSDEGTEPIADREIQKKMEVLRLLARSIPQKAICEQTGLSESTVYRYKQKALMYSASMIASFPRYIQSYITLEREKKSITPKTPSEQFASLKDHQKELSSVARNLVKRLNYARRVATKSLATEPLGEIIIDEPSLPDVDQYLASCLFTHVQPEIAELKNFQGWGQVPIGEISDELIMFLAEKAAQNGFPNRCSACRDLY